jgi:hypothetical protein
MALMTERETRIDMLERVEGDGQGIFEDLIDRIEKLWLWNELSTSESFHKKNLGNFVETQMSGRQNNVIVTTGIIPQPQSVQNPKINLSRCFQM